MNQYVDACRNYTYYPNDEDRDTTLVEHEDYKALIEVGVKKKEIIMS